MRIIEYARIRKTPRERKNNDFFVFYRSLVHKLIVYNLFFRITLDLQNTCVPTEPIFTSKRFWSSFVHMVLGIFQPLQPSQEIRITYL